MEVTAQQHIEERYKQWIAQMRPKQKKWHSNSESAYRNIISDRQAGLTMAMALEAASMGSKGFKQVIVAGSLEQAKIFRFYIVEWFGTKPLKSIDIEFHSARTLQDKHLIGSMFDIYIDSYLWLSQEELEKLNKLIDRHHPRRVTWMSARYPSWHMKMMEQVTHR